MFSKCLSTPQRTSSEQHQNKHLEQKEVKSLADYRKEITTEAATNFANDKTQLELTVTRFNGILDSNDPSTKEHGKKLLVALIEMRCELSSLNWFSPTNSDAITKCLNDINEACDAINKINNEMESKQNDQWNITQKECLLLIKNTESNLFGSPQMPEGFRNLLQSISAYKDTQWIHGDKNKNDTSKIITLEISEKSSDWLISQCKIVIANNTYMGNVDDTTKIIAESKEVMNINSILTDCANKKGAELYGALFDHKSNLALKDKQQWNSSVNNTQIYTAIAIMEIHGKIDESGQITDGNEKRDYTSEDIATYFEFNSLSANEKRKTKCNEHLKNYKEFKKNKSKCVDFDLIATIKDKVKEVQNAQKAQAETAKQEAIKKYQEDLTASRPDTHNANIPQILRQYCTFSGVIKPGVDVKDLTQTELSAFQSLHINMIDAISRHSGLYKYPFYTYTNESDKQKEATKDLFNFFQINEISIFTNTIQQNIKQLFLTYFKIADCHVQGMIQS